MSEGQARPCVHCGLPLRSNHPLARYCGDFECQRARKRARDRKRSFQWTRKTGRCTRCGRVRLTPGEVLGALAQARPGQAEIDEDDAKNVIVKITESEHRALKISAAEAGISIQGLVRTALAQAGLLGHSQPRP